MNNFRADISIKQLDDALSTRGKLDPNKVQSFMNEPHEFIEKIDGIKITLFRNDTEYSQDYKENWVVAYKNTILYPEEFFGVSEEQALASSGFTQYALIFRHLERVHPYTESIPRNTEFFLELAVAKHTLMRKYKRKQIFLLGSCESTALELGGYLQTNPGPLKLSKGSTELSLESPKLMYQGKFDGSYAELKAHLLSLPSSLGGTSEGVVVDYQGTLYKIQQADQTDPAARRALRDSYKGSSEDEANYWRRLKILNWDHGLDDQPLRARLAKYRAHIDGLDLPMCGSRSPQHVWDDAYTTGRMGMLERLPENQNGLILGRFQPLTSAHAEMIRVAATKHPKLFVAVVNGAKSSKDRTSNPFNFNLRKRLIEALGIPNLIVVETPTGNIRSILNRIPAGITSVYCGTDRVQSYQETIGSSSIKVIEIPRTNNVSGTNLRYALKNKDKKAYEQMSDPTVHGFFDLLSKEYNESDIF